MMVIATLSLLGAYLFGVYVEWKFYKGAVVAFYVSILIVYVMPQLYIIIASTYSSEAVLLFTLWGVLFFISFGILRFFLSVSIASKIRQVDLTKSVNCLIQPCLSLFFVAGMLFLLVAIRFDLSEAINLNWAELRESAPSLLALANILFILSSSLFIVLLKRGAWAFILVFMALLLVAVALIKSRAILVAYLAPALLYFFYNAKKTLLWWVVGVAVVFLSMGLYVSVRAIRHVGSIATIAENPALLLAAFTSADAGEFELINAAYYIFENSTETDEFYSDSLLRRMLFFYLPSDFDYLKPRDFSHAIWDSFTNVLGVQGSYHVGAVLDSYFNNRVLGFLLYPLLYVFIFTVFEVFSRVSYFFGLVAYGPIVTACFYIGRGSIYNGTMILFSVFIVFGLVILVSLAAKQFCRQMVRRSEGE